MLDLAKARSSHDGLLHSLRMLWATGSMEDLKWSLRNALQSEQNDGSLECETRSSTSRLRGSSRGNEA